MSFHLADGTVIPAVTAEQMLEVDRLAVEKYRLGILQMMENAGRNLSGQVMEDLRASGGHVVVLAGGGGNGGGGLCCARHLHNHGVPVSVVLDRPADRLRGAAARQLHILRVAGVSPARFSGAADLIGGSAVVVDALIGYSLRGAPRGRAAALIALCNRSAGRSVSLDVPSGLDATTGHATGQVVHAHVVLTLALPKTGLQRIDAPIVLADIGIPSALYRELGLEIAAVFRTGYRLPLLRRSSR
jgi:NAD(P)H-hydrate epimerase